MASAGDNALALLTLNPAEVVAVDLNPAQLACVQLRVAAFRHLGYPELLAFLGVTSAADRLSTYRRLRSELDEDARTFWDRHPVAVREGIIHAGKFERYLRAFGRWLLPLVHSPRVIRKLREEKTLAEQEAFYSRNWDNWRWRWLFRLFFGRAVMGRLGRDPAFFEHVGGPVAPRLLERTRHALTRLPTHSNPYLAYILTGTYPTRALPRFLRPESVGVIRDRLDRLRLVQGAVPEACRGRFDGFNLSDIFEYMSEPEALACYAGLLQQANAGARLVYWNMLVPRSAPAGGSRPMRALSDELHSRDQAWFYTGFHVDEVTAGGRA